MKAWSSTTDRSRHSLPGPIADFDRLWSLDLGRWPGLEAQIAALADDIAYVNHDIDDALRAGLFSVDDLVGAPLAGPMAKAVTDRYGGSNSGALSAKRCTG